MLHSLIRAKKENDLLIEFVFWRLSKEVNLKNKTKFILGKNLKKGRLPLTPKKVEI